VLVRFFSKVPKRSKLILINLSKIEWEIKYNYLGQSWLFLASWWDILYQLAEVDDTIWPFACRYDFYNINTLDNMKLDYSTVSRECTNTSTTTTLKIWKPIRRVPDCFYLSQNLMEPYFVCFSLFCAPETHASIWNNTKAYIYILYPFI